MPYLTFIQPSSSINPSFWNKFTELKLNVDKLEETQHHIFGYFSVISNETYVATLVEVDSTSFNQKFDGQNIYIPFHGKLLNKNTMDSFKECDKVNLINEEGEVLLKKIENGDILHDPSFLNCFIVLSFADLKKYHYYYWFAFPVPKAMIIETMSTSVITNEFSDNELQQLYEKFGRLDYTQRTFFLVEKTECGIIIHSLESKLKYVQEDDIKTLYFGFYNIANNAEVVRSQIKNYVALIIHYCKFLQNNYANFIAFRLSRKRSQVNCTQSNIYRLKLPLQQNTVTWVGWEKNERDKMGPRLANMKNTLDPYVIAENSVDLNLKLMKWRVLPEIDLEKIKNSKCLLLGAGTLGCSVARTLLAWGVRHITFVDNSTVSFSNPVRQSLFTYLDSVQMKPKSVAAAENLKAIFPGVNSQGFQFTIPMPGHSVSDSLLEKTKESVDLLIKLILEHNLIFLLMDSRESRWLPTLLANVYNKITINAALGFDTYLVMRHGIKNEDGTNLETVNQPHGYKSIRGTELGCYFCNDVTAPGNSTKDRTLDQQCTVTRPGVSQIAGALAVELAISVLQHKEGGCAPAFYKVSQNSEGEVMDIENQSLLGLIPHSIRGFLSSFEHILPATQKYQHCVACSDIVLREYRENGFEFLLKVFNSSKHLEDITHLTEIFEETDFGDVLEFSDDGDFS